MCQGTGAEMLDQVQHDALFVMHSALKSMSKSLFMTIVKFKKVMIQAVKNGLTIFIYILTINNAFGQIPIYEGEYANESGSQLLFLEDQNFVLTAFGERVRIFKGNYSISGKKITLSYFKWKEIDSAKYYVTIEKQHNYSTNISINVRDSSCSQELGNAYPTGRRLSVAVLRPTMN